MLKTSFTRKSLKKLLLLINVAKRHKVSVGSRDDYENKMFERSPLTSKNLDRAIDYLALNAKVAFT